MMNFNDDELFLFNISNEVDLNPHIFQIMKINDKKLLSGFFTRILMRIDDGDDKYNIISLVRDIDITIDLDNMEKFQENLTEYLNLNVKLLNFFNQISDITRDSGNDISLDHLRNSNLNLDYSLKELEFFKKNLLEFELFIPLVLIQEKIDNLKNE